MDDEPTDDSAERANDPQAQANEKADDFRMHAELAAVFEGPRKFDARILPKLDADLAREIQRGMGKFDKAREGNNPLIPDAMRADAMVILEMPETRGLSTNDYHIHRRPGEVMMVRWLAGEEVESFYQRLQAHFDAALNGFRAEERSGKEWKQDPKVIAYLDALDKIDVKLADRYFRDIVRDHHLVMLSTQTADEINIAYLADFIMSVSIAQIVGPASAPESDEPTERELAWFFKLFLLRGAKDGAERMCFFTYLQKSDDDFDFEEE